MLSTQRLCIAAKELIKPFSTLDASVLFDAIKPLYQSDGPIESKESKEALAKYEAEAVKRGEVAELASRQACLDAHEWKRLNDQSPIVHMTVAREDLEDKRPETA